jgi:hypothetical protein
MEVCLAEQILTILGVEQVAFKQNIWLLFDTAGPFIPSKSFVCLHTYRTPFLDERLQPRNH